MGSSLNNTSASVQASRLFVGRESIKLFKRFIMKVLLYWTALVFPGAILWGSVLQAQDAAGDRVNMVIAYSEDECPQPINSDEIVVCQILVEAERFRIPSNLRTSESPENTSWNERVQQFKFIGAFGSMSCSPAGYGGFTGCNQQMIEAAYADRDRSSVVRFAQLIEQARTERLSTIDTDAAEEQARVEQIERAYMERLERQRAEDLPGEQAPPALTQPN